MMAAFACTGTPTPPPEPVVPGPPAIPDTQTAVNAPFFVGQRAFANPLAPESDFDPPQATTRDDGGNSGVVDGPAPLGVGTVAGSAAVPLQAPLLWGRGGLTSGCQIELEPGVTKNCLAAVDTSTLTVEARWEPPGQDLNLATAVLDGSGRILVTTRQGEVFVVARPDSDGGTFQVVREIDLASHLDQGQGLLSAVADGDGNVWFTSGGPPPPGQASAGSSTDTTVGFITPGNQIVTATLSDQVVNTALAVDQEDVYLATAPGATAPAPGATATAPGATVPAVPGATATAPGATVPAGAADEGQVYDLTASGNSVQVVWHDSYDAGTSVKPGATIQGTGAPVVLLGSQYLAITDNADGQPHLLVFQRGTLPTSPSHNASTSTSAAPRSGPTTTPEPTTTTTVAGQTAPATVDPRLVCTVALFGPGASAVTTAPIGYSSGATTSVIVANGYNTPPPLTDPTDNGPANNIGQMPGGVTRIDVLGNGAGCQEMWTVPLRLETAPVLATRTGLIYGYTQDQTRAAAGNYIWDFVGIDYRTGNVIWQQRAGAGATKNDNGLPTVVGANGVLYQCLPLGLVWMHDVGQHP